MLWHQLPIEKVYLSAGSSPAGLSSDSVVLKREEFGSNELVEKNRKPAWLLFLGQFQDFMILVLTVAAIVSGIVGDLTDTLIILVIVILNAIIGFIQEYKAEKALVALKKLALPHASVLRDGQLHQLSSTELVPGDVVVLEAGNVVPADLRLMEAHALRIEESSLTGESLPVDKKAGVLKEDDLPLGDRWNMVYKSTLVTSGRGKGMVVDTGMHTEIGKIAQLLQEKESLTPLQKRMMNFGKKLSYIILLICLLLFGVGLLRGEAPLNMLLVSISLAVAAIPEALPAIITIALARGAKRMVRKKALIRKLPAVETLGSVSYICTDKTGTLTQNKMKVVQVNKDESNIVLDERLDVLSCAMLLNQDVVRDNDNQWIGDPTEVAMLDYLYRTYPVNILESISEKYPRVAELPFDADRKLMTTIHRLEQQYIAISKGAIESILLRMTLKDKHDTIMRQTSLQATQGIRVLGYAFRLFEELPETLTEQEIENNLQFAGSVGLIDPPREEVKAAINECKAAGIKPVMITGDHKETATSIARELGIYNPGDLVITGKELASLSTQELDDKVERIRVYARVSPEQKLRIVQSLQRRNHYVAMTGDGVNDAPSLKVANIGIAMGVNGTEVSKEAAHMILLDDNFATIVKAVKEGRRIYDNIRKFIKYIMTCNGAEIWTLFLAPILNLPIPLLPIQILWINLVTDGLPALALSAERADHDVMQRPPRKPDESLFSEGMGYHMIWVGLLMAFITLGTQAWAISRGDSHWQTMVLTVLAMAQLGHVLAVRSDHEFIYSKGLFSNLPLTITLIFTVILQLGLIYLPFANRTFKTQPLSISELFICFGAAAVIFHAVEAEKLVRRLTRKHK